MTHAPYYYNTGATTCPIRPRPHTKKADPLEKTKDEIRAERGARRAEAAQRLKKRGSWK